jgi:mono/diheme cytochrome c family protein
MRRLRSVGVAVLLVAAAGIATAQGPPASAPATPASPGAAPDVPAAAAPAPSGAGGEFDVEKLFASTCGWCHSDGGRAAGRGPKLMETALTDSEIAYRIKAGKQGAMPAFGSSFNNEQIKSIIQYIRNLKPADG